MILTVCNIFAEYSYLRFMILLKNDYWQRLFNQAEIIFYTLQDNIFYFTAEIKKIGITA